MREEMAEDWADPNEASDESDEVRVGRIVQHLLSLAGDEEARRLLGLDGTLEDNLDMMFVADPLAWIANDIAQAIRLEDDETDTVSLSLRGGRPAPVSDPPRCTRPGRTRRGGTRLPRRFR